MFEKLLDRLKKNHLAGRVNIIVLSDHGMSDIPTTHFIDLERFLTPDTYKLGNGSPLMQIIPNEGYEDEIFQKLSAAAAKPESHFKVYNNDTVPARWKIYNDQRFGPILAVAEPTYAFLDMIEDVKWLHKHKGAPSKYTSIPLTPTKLNAISIPEFGTPHVSYGNHGYNNEHVSMRAIFYAFGGIFGEGETIGPFNNVDLYPLFCRILKIKCIPTEGKDRSEHRNKLLKPTGSTYRGPDAHSSMFQRYSEGGLKLC